MSKLQGWLIIWLLAEFVFKWTIKDRSEVTFYGLIECLFFLCTQTAALLMAGVELYKSIVREGETK